MVDFTFISGRPRNCGGFLTESRGTISSPNWPNSYPHDSKCTWIFNGAVGSVIELQFTDFSLEQSTPISGRNYSYCLDWVKILEDKEHGLSDRSAYCGNKEPWLFKSSGNYLWIQFRSGSEVSGGGFSAQYDIIGTLILRCFI